MISNNLGIYKSYLREKAIEEVRSTPVNGSLDEDIELPVDGETNGVAQGRTFTPEDHKRYQELRRRIAESQKKFKENGNK